MTEELQVVLNASLEWVQAGEEVMICSFRDTQYGRFSANVAILNWWWHGLLPRWQVWRAYRRVMRGRTTGEVAILVIFSQVT